MAADYFGWFGITKSIDFESPIVKTLKKRTLLFLKIVLKSKESIISS